MKTKSDLEKKVWYKSLKIFYYLVIVIVYMLLSDTFRACADSELKMCHNIMGKILFTIGAVIITFIVTELLQRIVYLISLGSFNPPRK